MTTVVAEITEEQQALRDALAVQPPDIIEWLNELDYGEAGVGKTYKLGTAADHPDTSPVLIFDVEGGLTTIRHRKNIDTVPIRSLKEIKANFNKLYHSIKIDDATGKQSIYYKTVGIDSLSELAALAMKDIMQLAYDRNPDKVDKDVPSPREWGICREQIRDIVRHFRDLPCNVIYTAGVGTFSEEGQPTKYFPGFAGKLAKDVPGFMDIVGYMYNENVGDEIVRKIQFQSTRRIVAKDRTSTLGPFLENPTVPMMWDLIQGSTIQPTIQEEDAILDEIESEQPILSIITDEGEKPNE